MDNDEDCDDTNDRLSPDAREICDSIDNDCDGYVDDDDPDVSGSVRMFIDADGDGYGDSSDTIMACSTSLSGYVRNNEDCDDDDPDLNQDDSDGDGYSTCDGDCDDDDPDLNEDDSDGDGYSTCDGDCEDSDASIWSCDATSCLDQYIVDPTSSDGLYDVDPTGSGSYIEVYCDMSNGGWTLISQGGASCKSSFSSSETSSINLGDSCSYLEESIVMELSANATEVELRAGSSAGSASTSTTSTNSGAIEALLTGVTWHATGATFDNWTFSAACGYSITGWPNMFASSCVSSGVHWFFNNGSGGAGGQCRTVSCTESVTTTWIR